MDIIKVVRFETVFQKSLFNKIKLRLSICQVKFGFGSIGQSSLSYYKKFGHRQIQQLIPWQKQTNVG